MDSMPTQAAQSPENKLKFMSSIVCAAEISIEMELFPEAWQSKEKLWVSIPLVTAKFGRV